MSAPQRFPYNSPAPTLHQRLQALFVDIRAAFSQCIFGYSTAFLSREEVEARRRYGIEIDLWQQDIARAFEQKWEQWQDYERRIAFAMLENQPVLIRTGRVKEVEDLIKPLAFIQLGTLPHPPLPPSYSSPFGPPPQHHNQDIPPNTGHWAEEHRRPANPPIDLDGMNWEVTARNPSAPPPTVFRPVEGQHNGQLQAYAQFLRSRVTRLGHEQHQLQTQVAARPQQEPATVLQPAWPHNPLFRDFLSTSTSSSLPSGHTNKAEERRRSQLLTAQALAFEQASDRIPPASAVPTSSSHSPGQRGAAGPRRPSSPALPPHGVLSDSEAEEEEAEAARGLFGVEMPEHLAARRHRRSTMRQAEAERGRAGRTNAMHGHSAHNPNSPADNDSDDEGDPHFLSRRYTAEEL
ncbi:hypothetical protein JCM8547_005570 [Rhodosporidiobolus lusitaniae]